MQALEQIARLSRNIHGTIQRVPSMNLKRTASKLLPIMVKFTNRHVFPYTTAPAIAVGPNGPLFEYHLRQWESRAKEIPLWVSVVATKELNRHKVVKTTLQKRARGAYFAALRRQGYSKDGRKISTEATMDKLGNDQEGALRGTVQLTVLDACLKVNRNELQEQMDQVVQTVIQEQEPEGGPRMEKPQMKEKVKFQIHIGRESYQKKARGQYRPLGGKGK